ncbi:MAG: hypothetical protein ABWY03_07135 [Microbacterium sp.]
MSTTGNEFEQPGVNYPDSGEGSGATPSAPPDPVDEASTQGPAPGPSDVGVVQGADHHGQDGGGDNLTAGETQRDLKGAAEQSVPAMSQNNATDAAKIDGIIGQTRQDGHQDHDAVVHVLRQRFEQSGVAVPEDRLDELADRVLRQD